MIRQVSKHFLGALLIASVVVSLTSCVTQREGAFSSDADKQEAENAYVRLGLAYIQDENYGRARRHLDRALEINDESAPALAAKALISQEQGSINWLNPVSGRHLSMIPTILVAVPTLAYSCTIKSAMKRRLNSSGRLQRTRILRAVLAFSSIWDELPTSLSAMGRLRMPTNGQCSLIVATFGLILVRWPRWWMLAGTTRRGRCSIS